MAKATPLPTPQGKHLSFRVASFISFSVNGNTANTLDEVHDWKGNQQSLRILQKDLEVNLTKLVQAMADVASATDGSIYSKVYWGSPLKFVSVSCLKYQTCCCWSLWSQICRAPRSHYFRKPFTLKNYLGSLDAVFLRSESAQFSKKPCSVGLLLYCS